MKKQQYYFKVHPSPPFPLLHPVESWAFGRQAAVDLSPPSIHFNHNGQCREQCAN